MKSKLFLLLLLLVSFQFTACKRSKFAGSYTYKTECLGVELDGSQTLRVWGNGRNRIDAIEQAKKNGVRDVLFNGIRDGKTECNMHPLVPEVNAREKYEVYFNAFFADNGPYTAFISSKDGSDLHPEVLKKRQKSGSQETYSVIIRVLRPELKQKLITDGILK